MSKQPKITDMDALDLAIEWLDEREEEHSCTSLDEEMLNRASRGAFVRAVAVQARALDSISQSLASIAAHLTNQKGEPEG